MGRVTAGCLLLTLALTPVGLPSRCVAEDAAPVLSAPEAQPPQTQPPQTQAPQAQAPRSAAPEIIGHRGARGLVPENTLDGFAAALGIGVTRLHADIVSTRDGVLVTHDGPVLNPDIARRGGRWLTAPTPSISDLSYQDLFRFDVGRTDPDSRMGRLLPDQDQADGATIPALAELLKLVDRSRSAEVQLLLEIRAAPAQRHLVPRAERFAEMIAREVGAREMASRTIVTGLDWLVPIMLTTRHQGFRIALMTCGQRWLNTLERGKPGPSSWLAGFDADEEPDTSALVARTGAAVWVPCRQDLTPETLAAAKARGLAVWTFTVNAREEMETLVETGVDGLITDRPDLMRQVLAERGYPLPRRAPVKP